MRDFPLPEMTWERGVDGDGVAWVTVTCSKMPSLVNGWTADTRNMTR